MTTRATTTTTPTVLAPAPRRKPKGAEALTGLRHNVLAASRWRGSWEAGCQQLTAETGVDGKIMVTSTRARLVRATGGVTSCLRSFSRAFSTSRSKLTLLASLSTHLYALFNH